MSTSNWFRDRTRHFFYPPTFLCARELDLEDLILYNGTDMVRIVVDREKVAAFCRRHHIQKLAFFGSVLGDGFGPNSDVDVLVEFEPGHAPGLAFFAMEAELSQILGRKVDLNTPQFLSRYFRDQVLAEAEIHYAAS